MQKIHIILLITSLLAVSATAQKNNTYPVVIAFNSMCCGVPDNAPVIKLISSFKKQNKLKHISADSIGPMGREGEYVLAFYLKEMSRTQKLAFIRELKKTVPAMTDKGAAELKENEIINKADLSAGVRTTVVRY